MKLSTAYHRKQFKGLAEVESGEVDFLTSMINIQCARLYCAEDPSLIENYQEAVNDATQVWEIHHRRETQDGKTYSRRYLIKNGLYYKRPASELIFMTEEEHVRLHHSGDKNQFYGIGPFKGRKHSEESRRKMSKTHKANLTDELRIKRSMATKGRIWVNNGKINHLVLPDQIPDGFVRGKLRR